MSSNTKRVWNFLVSFMSQATGRSPTNREIRDELELSSTSVVDYHLNKLEKEGYIERRGKKYGTRQIHIVGAKWTPPEWDYNEKD